MTLESKKAPSEYEGDRHRKIRGRVFQEEGPREGEHGRSKVGRGRVG